jgi:hypothetical protein
MMSSLSRAMDRTIHRRWIRIAAVLRFKYQKIDSVNYEDRFITPLSELQTGQGSSITYINHPTGIATFPNSADFIVIQQSDGIQYSAIWMTFTKTSDFEGWLPKYDPSTSGSIDFIKPNRFREALWYWYRPRSPRYLHRRCDTGQRGEIQ